jgi:hypothetical protein
METQIEVVAGPVVAGTSSETQEVSSSSPERRDSGGFRDANGRPSMVEGVAEYDGWTRTGLSIRLEREMNDGGIAWQAAKWLVNGYRTFLGPGASNQGKGRLIKDAMRHSGLSRSTLITYIKVGFAFPDGPIVELSFAHHRAVTLIPNREDRPYWLRQAASKKMSVSDLKKAIKELIPSKPKLGIEPEQEADRYRLRLMKLNPKDHIWSRIIHDIEHGNSIEDYRELYNEMMKIVDALYLNFKQIESAMAGNPAPPHYVQDRIKPPLLVKAEKLEAIGTAVGQAA